MEVNSKSSLSCSLVFFALFILSIAKVDIYFYVKVVLSNIALIKFAFIMDSLMSGVDISASFV